VLSGDAEGDDDGRHADAGGQEGEFRVTLHPPRGLHVQRERPAVNRNAVADGETAARACPERGKSPKRRCL